MSMYLGIGICLLVILFAGLVVWNMFQIEKTKRKEHEATIASLEKDIQKIKNQNDIYVQEKKENEELKQKANSNNNLDSFNASVDLLQKQSEKGKHRNN